MDVVNKIAETATDYSDRPLAPQVMQKSDCRDIRREVSGTREMLTQFSEVLIKKHQKTVCPIRQTDFSVHILFYRNQLLLASDIRTQCYRNVDASICVEIVL